MSATWPYTAVTEPDFTTGAGLTDVPNTLTLITAATSTVTRIHGVWVENTLSTPETFTLADGAGVPIVPTMPLPPNMPATFLQFLFNLKVTGLQWQSSQASGIKGKVEGWN